MKNENRVEVFIPKGYAVEDPNVFVSINGRAYVLPRGKRVMVPAEVAAELHRGEAVLTAPEAAAYRSGQGAGAKVFNMTINAKNLSKEDLDMIVDYINRKLGDGL
jgi:hypothetical protein